MFARIRELGYIVGFVAQDGLENMADEIPWDEFDALFIGGTTEWKLGPAAAALAAEAKRRNKIVHMGRVNSRKRLAYAESIGCDTADGTYLTFGPEKNLPKLLSWLDFLNAPTPLAPVLPFPVAVPLPAAATSRRCWGRRGGARWRLSELISFRAS